jgi:guanine deaminase
MLTSLKLGGVMSRISRPDYENWATAKELWDSATVGGARALGREQELGRLAPGQRADIVFYRRDAYTLSPLNDPVRQITHGESGSAIDTVVVDGTLAMRGGTLTRIDEGKLIAEFTAAYEQLLPSILESEKASHALFAGIDRIYRKSLTVPIPSDTVVGWVTGANTRTADG